MKLFAARPGRIRNRELQLESVLCLAPPVRWPPHEATQAIAAERFRLQVRELIDWTKPGWAPPLAR